MKNLSFTSLLLSSLLSITNADTLKETVNQTKLTNVEILANQLKVKSEEKNIMIEKAGYYPSLDFEVYGEKSQLKNSPNSGSSSEWEKKKGINSSLKAEQLLYDGGKTSSLISQKKYSYLSTSYKYKEKNEKIILNIIKSYSELVEYAELNKIMDYSTIEHNNALGIALDKEEISGEVIETLKTKNMINILKDKKLIAQEKYDKAVSNYKKLTSKDISKTICRPSIDKSLIEKPISEIIKIAIENNYKIKEQKEVLKQQYQKISQERSVYKPNVKLNIDGIYDKDLEIGENVQKEIIGKVTLNWNFYSGGRDQTRIEKEQIILNEEKRNLDKITQEVIGDVTNLYNSYHTTKKRIVNFSESIDINKEILVITQNQLKDGTKTFIDVLQDKNKITDAQSNKTKQEFILINTYYELLKKLSILNKTISTEINSICKIIKVKNLIQDKDSEDTSELDLLLEETNPLDEERKIEEITKIKTISTKPIAINITKIDTNISSLADKLSDTFKNENYSFNKDTLETTLLITSSSFTKTGVNSNDKFKYLLDTFSLKFLKVLEKNQDQIKRVDIESYTSSEYRKYKTKEEKDKANYALSQKRADKVKDYFIKKSMEHNLNTDFFMSKFNAIGKGPENIITNDNNIENQDLSRRIIIKIIEN
ncbi:MAG TPA: hypothetical protein EYG73_00110 [Arcobacter sp.]|nr:hypothetical protein [Arcobacter sp.]